MRRSRMGRQRLIRWIGRCGDRTKGQTFRFQKAGVFLERDAVFPGSLAIFVCLLVLGPSLGLAVCQVVFLPNWQTCQWLPSRAGRHSQARTRRPRWRIQADNAFRAPWLTLRDCIKEPWQKRGL